MEELTDNAEEIAEEGDSTKDEKKLGRLQFKVGDGTHSATSQPQYLRAETCFSDRK